MKKQENKKLDRRVQRTRALLLKSLMELIVEKGFESISVQDITDRANVARTTFYLHYANKEELLYKGLQDEFLEIIEKIEPGQMDSPADWLHLQANQQFYDVMFSQEGSQSFTVQLFSFLEQMMLNQVIAPLASKEVNLPKSLIASYLAGAQYGLWRWWLTNQMPMSAEEISSAGKDLAVKGLGWALGISNLTPSSFSNNLNPLRGIYEKL